MVIIRKHVVIFERCQKLLKYYHMFVNYYHVSALLQDGTPSPRLQTRAKYYNVSVKKIPRVQKLQQVGELLQRVQKSNVVII